MALEVVPAATKLGAGFHRQMHSRLTEVRYAHPSGSDSNDGLTWGTAKLTILAAYDALPATGGTVRIADQTNVGGAVSQQGIWLVGPNDANYASPPTGWRQQKPVHFLGEPGAGQVIQFGYPAATILGGTTTFAYDSTTKPVIWLAGTTHSMVFENLNAYYVGVGARIGVGSNNDRSVNTSRVQFKNVHIATYNVGVSKSTPGNPIDIGYLFWGYFEHCTFQAYTPAALSSDTRAAILVKPDPVGESAGLIFFKHTVTAGGGLKFYRGATTWGLDVDDLVYEGAFGTAEMSAVWIVNPDHFGTANLRGVQHADTDPALSDPTIQIATGALAENILVTDLSGDITGPHTRLNFGSTDLALQGAVGFGGNRRIVGQHDGTARKFGTTAVRSANLATQDTSTWTGGATITTGQTAPDGTANAAKLSAASRQSRQVAGINRTFAIGDWLIASVWMKPSSSGIVGGAPGAVGVFGQAAPSHITFDTTSDTYFGGDTEGNAGRWEWRTFAAKVSTIPIPNSDIGMNLFCDSGHDMTYYAPMLLYVSVGSMVDHEVMEMIYHLSPWPDGAAVGGSALLRGQSLYIPSGYVEGLEIADPAAPAANTSRLYTRDNGAGKTQIVARFPTGAVQVIATEP